MCSTMRLNARGRCEGIEGISLDWAFLCMLCQTSLPRPPVHCLGPSVRPCGVTATWLVFIGHNSGDCSRRMRTSHTSSRRQFRTSYVLDCLLCKYINIYLYIRFAVTKMQRLFEERRMRHITGPVMAFSVFSDVLGMVSISVFSQVWKVDPWMAMYGHTLSFIYFFYVCYVSVLAMMLPSSGATFKGWVFLVFYSVVSAMLLMYYLSSVSYFAITAGCEP